MSNKNVWGISNRKYDFINDNIAKILNDPKNINLKAKLSKYLILIRDKENSSQSSYKENFIEFWNIGERIPKEFEDDFFGKIKQWNGTTPSLSKILTELKHYQDNLEITLGSKLLHTIDTSQPIADTYVRAFYWYTPRSTKDDFNMRMTDFIYFYNSLSEEYKRIIEHDLLQKSIMEFKNRYGELGDFSDVKLIDTILWSTINSGIFLKEFKL